MVEHIIKSLALTDVGTAVLVLGLAREVRLLLKLILQYKLLKEEKNK